MVRNTVENIFEMINILKTRDLVSGNELAQSLNVSKKTIQKYKDILDSMRIYVDTKKGRYGGYYLYNKNFDLPLSEKDFSVLNMAREYLKDDSGFLYFKKLDTTIETIKQKSKNRNDELLNYMELVYESKPAINSDWERNKYSQINYAVKEKKKINMNYTSLEAGESKRIINPYETFMYKRFWYVIGYCELRDEVRSFKIYRITSMEVLDETFIVSPDFQLKNSIDNSIGIFSGKNVKVKLKITHPMSQIIRERTWVKDQKITYDEMDKFIIFEAKMVISPETIGWILSMGRHGQVLEPNELKISIKEEIEKMKNNY